MPTNKRLFSQDAASSATPATPAAEGLVVHWDCNDEDSIENGGANTGSGSGTWFDISTHDLSVPRIAPSTNLILDLDFSDTASFNTSSTDTVNDVSPNNPSANGSINGSGTFASDTRGYYDFGTINSNFISIGSLGDFSTTSDLSFEVWVYTQANTTEQNLFGTSHSSTGVGYFFGVVNNPIQYNISDRPTSASAQATSGETKTDVWQHIVCTWDVSALKWTMYVDGTLATGNNTVGSGTASTPTNSSDVLKLNATNSTFGHSGWQGRFNSLRIYNRVLTASEVAQNFRADCFLSFSSIYSTNLAMNLDAANYTSGTWADSAGSNNGTINDAKFDKELGNFFDFDGSNDTITVSATASAPVDFSSETYSIGMWANIGTLANDKVLIGKFTTGSNRAFQIQISSSNKLSVLERGSGNFAIESTQTFTANTWFYFLYTRAASEAKIYVNGILDNTSSASETINDAGTTDITIGNQAGTSEHFTGKIGQVKIYSATLTPAQVAQNYLATKDNYPNGNNGTINGAEFDTEDLGAAANTNFFEMSSDTITSNFAFSNWGTTAWTIAFFARPHSANDGYFFATGNATGAAISFRNLTPPKAFLISSTGNTEIPFTLNQFKHFVFTYDGSGITKGYGNGVLTDQNTSVASHFSSTANFRLGNYGGSGTHFDGDVGQFKIFQKELSASEVSALYDLDKATYNLT
mgnify:FL=1|tara:strand:+ start:279 stop:2366 length:2088 start_codon:yes stop_codon:yes gene_type:complete